MSNTEEAPSELDQLFNDLSKDSSVMANLDHFEQEVTNKIDELSQKIDLISDSVLTLSNSASQRKRVSRLEMILEEKSIPKLIEYLKTGDLENDLKETNIKQSILLSLIQQSCYVSIENRDLGIQAVQQAIAFIDRSDLMVQHFWPHIDYLLSESKIPVNI